MIWSNLLGTTEADQYCHEQALSPDLCGVGIHRELEEQQLVKLTHRQESFLLQDHVAWSCPPVVHAQKPCPPSRSCTETRLSSPLSLMISPRGLWSNRGFLYDRSSR